jgi:hypothetical protein
MRRHDAKPPLVSHALPIGKSMKSLRIAGVEADRYMEKLTV